MNARVAMVVISICLTQSLGAQAADPWKKIPPLPTSCFADADYDARLNALKQELIADRERQEALNKKLLERFNAMSPMEKMSRMQQMMMKDPQAAAKMIEASANLGTEAGTTQVDVAETAGRLEKTLQDHKKGLDAAIDAALKPLLAKEAELVKAKTHLEGEAKVPVFNTPAAYAEYVAVIGEQNAAVEKACAPYFGPNGTMHAWLAQYRKDVLEPRLAFDQRSEAAMLQQISVVETPDSRYQPVSGFERARDLVNQLEQISQFRRRKAAPIISPP